MRVLHLDPDVPSRRDLAAELETAGHRVEQAETVADALARDAAQPCDLIVTETRLADGGVLDLLRRLHRARNGTLPPLAVLAAHSEPGLRELCERAGVRRFLRKADDWPVNASELHGLLAELEPPAARVAPAASRASSRVFRGSLESVDLVEVVQLLNLGRKSGTLLLTGGSREGRLHLHDGDLIAAACGASTGAEAFRALLGARGGTFRFEVGEAPVTRTIHQPTPALLLDVLRQEDEDGRAGAAGAVGLDACAPGVYVPPDRGAGGISGDVPDATPDDAFAFDVTPPSHGAGLFDEPARPLDEPAGPFDDVPPLADRAAALDHSAPPDHPWPGDSSFDEPRSLDHEAALDHSAPLDRPWSDDSSSLDQPPHAAPAPAARAPAPPTAQALTPPAPQASAHPQAPAPAYAQAQAPAAAQRHGPAHVPTSPPIQASRDSSRLELRPLRLTPDLTVRRPSRRRGPPLSRLWLFAGGAAAALAAGYAVHTAGTHSSEAAPELEREDVRTLLLEAAEDQARIDSLDALVQELLRASARGSGAGR